MDRKIAGILLGLGGLGLLSWYLTKEAEAEYIIQHSTTTVDGLEVPVFYNSVTGKPSVGAEYRPSKAYTISYYWDGYCSQSPRPYPRLKITIPSGTWIINAYNDGTVIEYLYGTKYIFCNTEFVFRKPEEPLVENELASTYHILPSIYYGTSDIGYNHGRILPNVFVLTLLTKNYTPTAEEHTGFYLRRQVYSYSSQWVCLRAYEYDIQFSPEAVAKFIEYGFDDTKYKDEIATLQTSGQDYKHIQRWMNNVLFLRDNIIRSCGEYMNPEVLMSWYYNYLTLMYLYAGYSIQTESE